MACGAGNNPRSIDGITSRTGEVSKNSWSTSRHRLELLDTILDTTWSPMGAIPGHQQVAAAIWRMRICGTIGVTRHWRNIDRRQELTIRHHVSKMGDVKLGIHLGELLLLLLLQLQLLLLLLLLNHCNCGSWNNIGCMWTKDLHAQEVQSHQTEYKVQN